MSILRNYNTDYRNVDGFTFKIESQAMMDYNGEWKDNGFEVTINKKKTHLCGYPIDNDLRKLIQSIDK